MIEWVISVLDMVFGPKEWCSMSGPAVASGAVLFGMLGISFAVGGGSALAAAQDNAGRFASGIVLVLGLALLLSVFAGVRAFHRAQSEKP
ncbi:MAG TPA: hypothetical protein VKX28_25170 [Xanthobacteraceae bacterium]|nr:hypothetical protein [Xanthobacteraceae bacterium]